MDRYPTINVFEKRTILLRFIKINKWKAFETKNKKTVEFEFESHVFMHHFKCVFTIDNDGGEQLPLTQSIPFILVVESTYNCMEIVCYGGQVIHKRVSKFGGVKMLSRGFVQSYL